MYSPWFLSKPQSPNRTVLNVCKAVSTAWQLFAANDCMCECILSAAGGRQPADRLWAASGGPNYFTDCHLDQQGCAGHSLQLGHVHTAQARNEPGPDAIQGLCQHQAGQNIRLQITAADFFFYCGGPAAADFITAADNRGQN